MNKRLEDILSGLLLAGFTRIFSSDMYVIIGKGEYRVTFTLPFTYFHYSTKDEMAIISKSKSVIYTFDNYNHITHKDIIDEIENKRMDCAIEQAIQTEDSQFEQSIAGLFDETDKTSEDKTNDTLEDFLNVLDKFDEYISGILSRAEYDGFMINMGKKYGR